ncbi:MAG: hypothetical protein AAGF98_09350, partial [Cyanobacteria bacterium P01_H01_bin.153]
RMCPGVMKCASPRRRDFEPASSIPAKGQQYQLKGKSAFIEVFPLKIVQALSYCSNNKFRNYSETWI